MGNDIKFVNGSKMVIYGGSRVGKSTAIRNGVGDYTISVDPAMEQSMYEYRKDAYKVVFGSDNTDPLEVAISKAVEAMRP